MTKIFDSIKNPYLLLLAYPYFQQEQPLWQVEAVFLILAGLIPKLGAVVSTIPQSVIGGASLIIFSQITLTGIDILTYNSRLYNSYCIYYLYVFVI